MHLSNNTARRIGNGHYSGAGAGAAGGGRQNYQLPIALLSFLLGSIISTTLVLNSALTQTSQPSQSSSSTTVGAGGIGIGNLAGVGVGVGNGGGGPLPIQEYRQQQQHLQPQDGIDNNIHNPLHGLRILIAIAAFDFSQIPHLEEVLDSYQDLCLSGASKVDVVIHSTVAYPVTLIDLWNTRLLPACRDNNVFTLTVALKSPSLRLHLVDCHRELFYEKIDDYDLFIYTEDDIRVPPRTVGAYMEETQRVEKIFGGSSSSSSLSSKPSDFNVGIVRYEYNYPNNVVIDDKTRHATQNVTRVYWEHGQYPIFPKAVDDIKVAELKDTHLTMGNHHQGMFLATQSLLKAWKDRKGCDFDRIRDRPGHKNKPSQPSEGTQRVWMSSQMLYGGRHCGVQQVIPIDSFGTLTVLHLPNKNYRRVGHFKNRTFSDGTEKFDHGLSSGLLTAMALHIEVRRHYTQQPRIPYDGIKMVDEVGSKGRTPLLERRLGEYQAYVDRGGVLSPEDFDHTALAEEI
mmetsp:Transcript_32859/g.79873  ORF Transcript_32859/g.79873 Transcript_32859/m.79873 type:complete len:513 (+) Transcript_32859:97-1635(+)